MAVVKKITGVTVRSGNYENKPWKNLYISTSTKDDSDSGTLGVFCENFKIQFKKLNDVLGLGLTPDTLEALTVSDFQNLLGKEVKLYFDNYHNVDYIIVINKESK